MLDGCASAAAEHGSAAALPREAVQPGGHLDVLAAIPAEYRAAVLQQCERRSVKRGQFLWRQGDRAEFVAFLVSGKAMSLFQSRNGKSGTTGFWSAGALLGAADLGTASTRQMTLRCLDDCLIHTMRLDRFEALVLRFPELALAVIRALSVRLRWVADLALTLETQSALQRICTVLLVLSERFAAEHARGVLIDLHLTNEDLAAMAGVSRQFLNATLQELRQGGALVTERRRLIVPSRAHLQALANSA
jgi:CRP/FNR family transcriptional regulator